MVKTSLMDKYSDEELLNRLKASTTFQSFLEGLGYSTGRAQHTRNIAKRRFDSMGIDYRDYLEPNYVHASRASRTPNEQYYVKGIYRGSALSKRVKKDGLIPYACAICGNTGEWLGTALTLQLDHIDGDNTNNELDNLRYLCPNCHSQTETFCNKNNYARVSQLAEEVDLESIQ